mmetsp:Transcript_44325/g.73934  ORF Transcript_44325/g.73934 Transcript_44325/m.73934 type:complete len:1591 (+) Transcript_44325:133-4905(+)
MEVKHVASLKKVTLHEVATGRRMMIAAFIVVLYAVSGHFVYTTIGEPRRMALAQKKAVVLDEWFDDPWGEEVSSRATTVAAGGAHTSSLSSDGMGELSVVNEKKGDASSKMNDDDPDNNVREEPVVDDEGGASSGTNTTDESSSSSSTKKNSSKKRIPSHYQPNAWAGAALFLVISGHILFHLMCYWRPAFKAKTLFQPATKIRAGLYALVEPHLHRGKAALVPISKTGPQGQQKLAFLFQRLRYEFNDAGNYVSMLKCPIDHNLSFYARWKGLSEREEKLRKEHYGLNVLSVPPPKFIDLYKEQLVSPIVVFQVFCAVLWALDEYWQYTVFQLFSILMLESASVFQRIKTINSLNGMSAKATLVKVFRGREWRDISTENLVPGDIMSIKYTHPDELAARAKNAKAVVPNNQSDNKKSNEEASSKSVAGVKQREKQAKAAAAAAATALNVVPCDCLLLSGSAVANEASLTGESIPQMKDSIHHSSEESLNIHAEHRIHTLFSGTMLVNTIPESKKHPQKNLSSSSSSVGGSSPSPSSSSSLPKTPDGGCLAFVLRTGFSSSQGELMQMIEFSTQKVADNSRETFLALLVLLLFALAAAGYVLYKGIQKGERSTHELLLRCVIIIASVVPRQLPMQMAVAVNTALLALMRQGVFCTEPFRMPFAGKITHCLFDKTGTLTTDQLLPVGVLNATSKALQAGGGNASVEKAIEKVANAEPNATMVLAGCHSLVSVEGAGLVGDPIELAAIKGVEWTYNPKTSTSTPGSTAAHVKKIQDFKNRIAAEGKQPTSSEAAAKKWRERVKDIQRALEEAKDAKTKTEERARKFPIRSVRILNRFHFLSKLQRMSVIADITIASQGTKRACLVKGSPEALSKLMKKENTPSWYDKAHSSMAERGMRVLALAYKWVPQGAARSELQDRKWVESDLKFAGFIAFACNTRSDSRLIVQALRESNHKVAMITGDAHLTALHVAGEVGIGVPRSENTEPLVLKMVKGGEGGAAAAEEDGDGDDAKMMMVEWEQALSLQDDQKEKVKIAFDVAKIPDLGKEHTLMVTEKALLVASELTDGEIWKHVDCLHVFARMSPQGKARVIASMQEFKKHHVLMCGDGGNDVGALKQADVGLALLSGYGNTNAGSVAVESKEKSAEESLNLMTKELKKRSLEASRLQKQLFSQKQKELMSKQKEWMQEEIKARQDRGEDVGVMATFSIMRSTMSRMYNELKEEKSKLAKKYGNVYDQEKPTEATEDTVLPTVRPGDASVAAPFTSRAPSVQNVVTLIRQGRCTLLSALQQQQIMMLECIITAYTLAALSLEGARSSQRQMMASSWLIMIASLSFSYSKPVDALSKVRPLSSLFDPAVFLSMLGQAAIHLACMSYAVTLATTTMGEEKLREVVEFHKRDDEAEAALLAAQEEGGAAAEEDWDFWSMWEKPFLPNLMNTVIFLVETSQIIAILFVNYKGRPWMNGLMENHSLFLSIFLCVTLVATCAWGYFPQLNTLIHLEPFPDDHFRWQVMGLVGASLVGTFLWDRIIVAIFARPIFQAMIDSAKSTRLKDLRPLVMTVFKVVGGVLLLGSGNILLWIGAFYAYRRFFRNPEA